MATYRLEFDASGEPHLIEEENGSFKTPMNDLPLPNDPARARDKEAIAARKERAA